MATMWCLLVAFLAVAEAVPVPDADVAAYLTQYGFMPSASSSSNLRSSSSVTVSAALKDFQSTFGLAVTGTLNDETRKLMATPRCGMKDKGETRHKRALQYFWRRGNIRYHIASFPPGLDRNFVRSEMNRAFAGWRQFMTRRTFQEVGAANQADIVLNFYTNAAHNGVCNAPWASNTLAHAFYPENGQVHFNLGFSWTEPDMIGSLFFHEIGHALGLDHVTGNELNLMNPYYVRGPKHFAAENINALRSTYS